MNKKPEIDKPGKSKPYCFRLFITGASPNSTKAVANLKKLFDTYLPGNYELDVIDVYQQPAIAAKEGLVVLPLLICDAHFFNRRFVGDMSDEEKIINSLGLRN